MLVPAMASMGDVHFFQQACSTPTCAVPRAPPPDSTRPMRGPGWVQRRRPGRGCRMRRRGQLLTSAGQKGQAEGAHHGQQAVPPTVAPRIIGLAARLATHGKLARHVARAALRSPSRRCSIVHGIKTGRNQIWIWVLVLLPYAGILAYVAAELLPELLNSRTTRRTMRDVKKALNPEADLRQLAQRAETRRRRRRAASAMPRS